MRIVVIRESERKYIFSFCSFSGCSYVNSSCILENLNAESETAIVLHIKFSYARESGERRIGAALFAHKIFSERNSTYVLFFLIKALIIVWGNEFLIFNILLFPTWASEKTFLLFPKESYLSPAWDISDRVAFSIPCLTKHEFRLHFLEPQHCHREANGGWRKILTCMKYKV